MTMTPPDLFQFDGIHVVSGSLDTSIRVWDVETGACKHALMGHQSLTSGMELKDNILVSGNADSTVKVWDITTGQCLQTLSGKKQYVLCILRQTLFLDLLQPRSTRVRKFVKCASILICCIFPQGQTSINRLSLVFSSTINSWSHHQTMAPSSYGMSKPVSTQLESFLFKRFL